METSNTASPSSTTMGCVKKSFTAISNRSTIFFQGLTSNCGKFCHWEFWKGSGKRTSRLLTWRKAQGGSFTH